MSADNGIYILETFGNEYRVVHAQNIENIYDEQGHTGFNLPTLWDYFHKAAVFCAKEPATNYANTLANKVCSAKEMCPILEYEINHIPCPIYFPKERPE